MNLFRAFLVVLAACSGQAAWAQDKPEAPRQSTCLAVARSIPGATFASFTPAVAPAADKGIEGRAGGGAKGGIVTITYAGHATFLIDTPAGVRIATDFSGAYGTEPPPDVATMNHAHGTHYTDFPDPRIAHVLRGWDFDGKGPAHHVLTVDDVYIRNVTTDIRSGGGVEKDGNSIFIFEVAGLCLGHLGHLHHDLTDAHYAAIGRLDVLMVPVDNGYTQSLANMSLIAKRLASSVILPMHRFGTPIEEFAAMMGRDFAVERRASRSIAVSVTTLPKRPTIVVLEGV